MAIAITIIILLFIIAALIYAFLIMPRIVDQADMELQSVDCAHRGLWNKTLPENSLAAFRNAAAHSYGIELDIQMSSDGKIFVFHDRELDRMCGVDSKISDLSSEEIKRLSLLNTEHKVPLLSEVFEAIDGRVPLIIEIKTDAKEKLETVCRTAAELLDGYGGAFAIQSFDPNALAWFKKYRPRFARGQLVTRASEYTKALEGKKHAKLLGFALSHMLTNIISRPDFISVEGTHLRTPEVFIITKLFRAKGFVWTVRNPKAYKLTKSKEMLAIFEVIRP